MEKNQKIIDETGALVDTEDDGKVSIFCADLDALEHTVKLINYHVKDVK